MEYINLYHLEIIADELGGIHTNEGYTLNKHDCIDKINMLTNNQAKWHSISSGVNESVEVYMWFNENNNTRFIYRIVCEKYSKL
jgi:hypothetical protein